MVVTEHADNANGRDNVPVAEPLDKCQWCKGKKVRCVEKTGLPPIGERTGDEKSKNRHLNVWLCPDCDGRALNFAKVEQPSDT